jgi:uncharacterized protein involved in outer membrane biogenesis
MNLKPHDDQGALDTHLDLASPNETLSGINRGDHRKRRIRIARNIIIGVLGTLFAVWLVLLVTKGRFLKGTVEGIASSMTERKVTVEGDFQLYFAPFRIKFLAEGLTVSNPEWATRPHLFTARKVDTRIAPFALLIGNWRLNWLDLTDGAVDLEWNARRTANTWTFDSDDTAQPLKFPTIDRASLRGTSVRYRDPVLQLLADVDFASVISRNAKIGETVRFTGNGTLRETPFTLTGAFLTPNATVQRGQNKLELQAKAANNVIDISGTLPGLADVEGVPLAIVAHGRNAAELMGIIGVVIPQTRKYQANATMVKQGRSYRFTDLAGTFGASDITGKFTVDMGRERVHIDADLETKTLDIIDVAPFIGYNPDVVAASGVQAAAAASGAAPARLLPNTSLRAEGLRMFDADVRYRAGRLRSDSIPISDVSVTVDLDDGMLRLLPLTLTMARGKLTSNIAIDWRSRPAITRYDIRLGSTPMALLLGGFGVAEAGTTGTIKGRIQLTGTGDALHASLGSSSGRIAFVIPEGTFWTRNAQLAELDFGTFVQKMFEDKLKDPVQINCGLVAFTVRDGVAAADPILIDTRKNVIAGRGGFSFNTEQMDMAFRADGKKFSLISGQSPVSIGGYFSQPKLNVISPELLGRAGAGMGLAALAAPPAALLAFVDVGDAKSASCGPILQGATAAGQRTTEGKPRDDVGTGKSSRSNGDEPKRKKFLGIF